MTSDRIQEIRQRLEKAKAPEGWAAIYGTTIVSASQYHLPLGGSVDPVNDAIGFAQPIARVELHGKFIGWQAFQHRPFCQTTANDRAEFIAHAPQDITDLLAALSTAEAQLAECYRLSGADPDGNEDWRLAPYAVNAVKNLRANLDEADQEAEKLREKLATAEAEGRRQERERINSAVNAAYVRDEINRECAIRVRQLLPVEQTDRTR